MVAFINSHVVLFAIVAVALAICVYVSIIASAAYVVSAVRLTASAVPAALGRVGAWCDAVQAASEARSYLWELRVRRARAARTERAAVALRIARYTARR